MWGVILLRFQLLFYDFLLIEIQLIVQFDCLSRLNLRVRLRLNDIVQSVKHNISCI